jgi:ABC-type nitrate/sulfonate/bicarbonate transport system permease component
MMVLVTSDYFGSQLSILVKQYFIFLLVGLTGWVRAYISPSFSAILAQLVSQESLVQAASYNSMTWLIAAVIGPAFAGLMIGFFSISFSFLVGHFINDFGWDCHKQNSGERDQL